MASDGSNPEAGPIPRAAQEVLDVVADLARRIKERKRRQQQQQDDKGLDPQE